MGLLFSRKAQTTDSGVSLEAFDTSNNRVVVKASQEAIDDYGIEAVQDKASDKFDSGDFGADGFIRVTTDDLK